MATSSNNSTKKTSTSETGHKKNVENLETIIIDCQGFGTTDILLPF